MFENVSPYAVVGIAIAVIALIAAIAALTSTFFTVEQRTTAIVQRLGKFVREAGAGLNVKVPFLDSVLEAQLQGVQTQLPGHHVHLVLDGEGHLRRAGGSVRPLRHLVRHHVHALDVQVREAIVAPKENRRDSDW